MQASLDPVNMTLEPEVAADSSLGVTSAMQERSGSMVVQ